ncbi:host attachment family protein [Phaeobacter sp. QD34_3]|uniref:host attachment family protein n=1 Tax=unclassified Phaeobacter TaxID=2621772 RepID=UPI00237F9B89|nr:MULTISPECIES: host attachment family protein [unclassified Phaeobacter]MDE4133232.1 host attachment family protein [Phaeobacter sp. QD34_3]MDE4136981.1 host attachment family protein [Phaeobacter sp. QD34_24]MDE4172728.1 host attachment family protein [Phaeobacter sp. PT47_59]
MLRLPKGLWILVADGQKALFLENVSDTTDADLRVMRVDEIDNPATAAQGSDAPGRFSGDSGAARGAVEPADWHQMGEDHFAAGVAALVNKWVAAGACSSLAVIAPPKALGALRSELSDKAQKLVMLELAKDLTNHPVPEIAAALKSALAPA